LVSRWTFGRSNIAHQYRSLTARVAPLAAAGSAALLPWRAAGDGRVNFEGARGGYGNAIMLSHGNGVSTLYGHLARFARGVRVGSHVNQGPIIGSVGMSGFATGPHLHHEYLLNGVHVDPQIVRLPEAEALRGQPLAEFRTAVAPLAPSLN
jgi:murein DD-endopeptidase MepM/ murein hydrolase activator NlpD